MKILLIQTMEYLYPLGGAHKANRILMETLAQKGHACRVISRLSGSLEYFYERLYQNKVDDSVKTINDRCLCFCKNGVDVFTITKEFYLFSFIKEQSKDFEPDITIISEDHTGLLMDTAFETASRIVYIAHTQATLPFGPAFFGENPWHLRLFKKLQGVISVSRFIKNYILEWADVDSEVIYFPFYGKEPYFSLGNFENKYVTIINPSGIKGIDIFIALARHFSDVSFAAVPTWSTSESELEILKSISNITILEPQEEIDIIYRQTKILLVPSLWGEAFGQVTVEAMLRGIPVVSSNAGGLPEAKLGVDYIIPVNPIVKYIPDQFSSAFPQPVVPQQNIKPWIDALDVLLHNKQHYMELSEKSRQKALEFAKSINIENFETFFQRLIESTPLNNKPPVCNEDKKANILRQIEKLPPQTREKLLLSLTNKRKQSK
ncbi:MAG: glycosyltransferase family 4 protein [Clostridia bacterium]|nr:glycosyltransferase family 4 protein [Clostridia bacterium]